MSVKCYIFMFIVVCDVLAVNGEINIDLPLQEYILAVGQDINITCSATEPVKWVLPNSDIEFNQTRLVKNKEYKAILNIKNFTCNDVGFYNCTGKILDTFVYLYADDPVNLNVPVPFFQTGIPHKIVAAGSNTVIPCRPTSPEVEVILKKEEELVSYGTLNDRGGLYTFHPFFGFFINDTMEIGEFYFTCTFARNGTINNLSFFLYVEESSILYKPDVTDLNSSHTEIGQKLALTCNITVPHSVMFSWITPNNHTVDKNTTSVTLIDGADGYRNTLIIKKTTAKDSGIYTCVIEDHHNQKETRDINVTLIKPGHHFLDLFPETTVLTVTSRENATFIVQIKSHPAAELYWEKNGLKLLNTSKYLIRNTPDLAILNIINVDITDCGNYTLKVSNYYTNDHINCFLNVTDKPVVYINTTAFHLHGNPSTVMCEVAANPPPSIFWFFKACANCKLETVPETSLVTKSVYYVSTVTMNVDRDGFLICQANNSFGEDKSETGYYITDVENGFAIFDFEPDVYVVNHTKVVVPLGVDFSMTCGASSVNYSDVTWMHNNSIVKDDIEESSTQYSYRVKLKKYNIQFYDGGLYSCRSKKHQMPHPDKRLVVIVKPNFPISVNVEPDVDKIDLKLGQVVELSCYIYGIPKPLTRWTKDNEEIEVMDSEVLMDKQPYQVLKIQVSKDGVYECSALSGSSKISKQINVNLEVPSISWYVIAILAFAVTGAATALYYAYRTHLSKKKLELEMKKAGLENFKQGAIENINPNLAIGDQADLLPYDDNFEFPIENLKLGKQLGCGAFGVVLKAVAKNIVDDEENTIVAVKMVKKTADYTLIKALASELKIMVHLGKHINVLNLLGACTKNVAKRELLVIVEFCRFGNIHNYLLKHRRSFINQVDPNTGSIDYTIGADILNRTYSITSSSPSTEYANLSFPKSGEYSGGQGYRSYSVNYTGKTELTSLGYSTGEEIITSNNSIQPEWRSNYRGDYKGTVKPICTQDLLCWAFQVSRGMEYLASRKVLHGDLAARNILLAEGNVVKISDFGLAKSMYNNENYLKQGNIPLPIKWMAIESIRDRVFSTQSDIWSFGVVLWELFSLSRTPYPEMDPNQTLFERLVDGYRMEKPEYASKEIYKMMLDCWNEKPQLRPSFTKLAERLGEFLEDTVRKHYIDLNDPYLVMNTQKRETGDDYLAMLRPPDYEVFSSPDAPEDDQDGYLCMNSSDIFSPRIKDGQVFDFPIAETVSEPSFELRPTAVERTSFSNPSYHLPPKVKNVPEIVKFADNYVNMPKNKQDLNDARSEKEKCHYINDCTRDWESVINNQKVT